MQSETSTARNSYENEVFVLQQGVKGQYVNRSHKGNQRSIELQRAETTLETVDPKGTKERAGVVEASNIMVGACRFA